MSYRYSGRIDGSGYRYALSIGAVVIEGALSLALESLGFELAGEVATPNFGTLSLALEAIEWDTEGEVTEPEPFIAGTLTLAVPGLEFEIVGRTRTPNFGDLAITLDGIEASWLGFVAPFQPGEIFRLDDRVIPVSTVDEEPTPVPNARRRFSGRVTTTHVAASSQQGYRRPRAWNVVTIPMRDDEAEDLIAFLRVPVQRIAYGIYTGDQEMVYTEPTGRTTDEVMNTVSVSFRVWQRFP